MCVFCEMKNVIEVFPVHFLEVPKLLKTMVTQTLPSWLMSRRSVCSLWTLRIIRWYMVQSLLRHGPERVFFFFFSENIGPAAAGPAGPAPAPLKVRKKTCLQ